MVTLRLISKTVLVTALAKNPMEVKFSFLLFRVFISLIKMQSDIDRKSNLMKPEILAQWWRTLPHSLPGEKTQTGGVGAHERGIQRVASGGVGWLG